MSQPSVADRAYHVIYAALEAVPPEQYARPTYVWEVVKRLQDEGLLASPQPPAA